MSRQSQYEREEERIQQSYALGEITNAEMWAEMRELQRDYAAAARESAQSAYEDEMERW